MKLYPLLGETIQSVAAAWDPGKVTDLEGNSLHISTGKSQPRPRTHCSHGCLQLLDLLRMHGPGCFLLLFFALNLLNF